MSEEMTACNKRNKKLDILTFYQWVLIKSRKYAFSQFVEIFMNEMRK